MKSSSTKAISSILWLALMGTLLSCKTPGAKITNSDLSQDNALLDLERHYDIASASFEKKSEALIARIKTPGMRFGEFLYARSPIQSKDSQDITAELNALRFKYWSAIQAKQNFE